MKLKCSLVRYFQYLVVVRVLRLFFVVKGFLTCLNFASVIWLEMKEIPYFESITVSFIALNRLFIKCDVLSTVRAKMLYSYYKGWHTVPILLFLGHCQTGSSRESKA